MDKKEYPVIEVTDMDVYSWDGLEQLSGKISDIQKSGEGAVLLVFKKEE